MPQLIDYGFNGKTAIVTGAGTGIGESVAIELAKGGAKVALFGRRLSSTAAVRDKILQFNGDVINLSVDVGNEDSVKKGIAEVMAKFGRIDILVNNAGVEVDREPGQTGGDFFDTLTEEQYFGVLRTNLLGHYYMYRNVIPYMRERKFGRIVNVTSVTGLNGGFGSPAYTSSKAAAMCQTKAFAKRYAKDNITVNSVAPGMVDTPMHDLTPRSEFEVVAKMTPLGYVAKPIDVARVVLFFAQEHLFVTGQNLVVDGGSTM